MAMTFTPFHYGSIMRLRVDWTSDSSGDASATTLLISGELIKGITNPDGTDAPTDDYDITVKDEESFDILSGCEDDLVDRDTANTEEVYFLVLDQAGTPLAQSVHPVVCDKLTIAVASAGSAKKGRLNLYFRQNREQQLVR
jgi:hypothetical protein